MFLYIIFWIMTFYIFMGIAISTIEVYETWRWPVYYGKYGEDRLGVTKKEFLKMIFLWLPLLYLALTTQRNQDLAKIKFPP